MVQWICQKISKSYESVQPSASVNEQRSGTAAIRTSARPGEWRGAERFQILTEQGGTMEKKQYHEINQYKDAYISIGECCRIFREHLQTTPYRFLTEYRIRKSVELLTGDLSISEIAGHCGYNQTSNYIAKFKSIMNCTPAQYRIKHGI